MAHKCLSCGKKFGRKLNSCPFCTNSQKRINSDKFYNHCQIAAVGDPEEIKSYGIDPEKEEKRLRSLIDKVVQRLPDEEPFKKNCIIIIGTRQGIIDTLESTGRKFPDQRAPERFLDMVKDAKREWDSRAKYLLTDEDISKASREIHDNDRITDADGNSEIFGSLDPDGSGGYSFDAIFRIDYRNRIRSDEYFMGVIAHEFAEYTTKYYAVQNHLDEINDPDQLQQQYEHILRKYIKSGTVGEEYKEHEKIVNREAARLGFEEEIGEMDKKDAF